MSKVFGKRLVSVFTRYGSKSTGFSTKASLQAQIPNIQMSSSASGRRSSSSSSIPKDLTTEVEDKAVNLSSGTGTTVSIGKAMKSYLERAEAHQKFMKEQEEEFVFGRRHLANMMGKDPETFTQQDIDAAIRYLFPSSLIALARPMMKPPHEVFPRAKAAQFDASGRPHHSFFYTAKPNFYYIIYEAVNKMTALNALSPLPTNTVVNYPFSGTVWISNQELQAKILETLSDELYNEWVVCMDRLAAHPRHEKEKEFIESYRKPMAGQNLKKVFPPVLLEADGKQSVKVEICTKKTALGNVTVKMPGSGKIDINGQGLEYFQLMRAREAFIYPLQHVNWLGTVDIIAKISGSGVMAQAAALRWGVAMAIAALGADVDMLRVAGLLTKDRRRKERRHRGCEGARAAWTWKKR